MEVEEPKKRPSPKTSVDDFDIHVICGTINQLYITQKRDPFNVAKLIATHTCRKHKF